MVYALPVADNMVDVKYPQQAQLTRLSILSVCCLLEEVLTTCHGKLSGATVIHAYAE